METNSRYITDMDYLVAEMESHVSSLESVVNERIAGSIKNVIREWRVHTRGYINELTDAVDSA